MKIKTNQDGDVVLDPTKGDSVIIFRTGASEVEVLLPEPTILERIAGEDEDKALISVLSAILAGRLFMPENREMLVTLHKQLQEAELSEWGLGEDGPVPTVH